MSHQNKVKVLSHLKDSIPNDIKGYSIGFYSIALEGWRRGLSLKFINKNRKKAVTLYELSSKERTHSFTGSRGDLVNQKVLDICSDKSLTKKYLTNSNVPTPKGKTFIKENTNEEVIKFANNLGYPLVIKPIIGRAGIGVIAGIENESEMKKALQYVRDELGHKSIIVEEHFEGEDYRVLVVGKEVVAVIKRIPANVIGDGTKTIKELITEKNKFRKNNPVLSSSLIKIDDELLQMLRQYNYDLNSVPKKDEIVYLKSKNNISAGGDPVDITDSVSKEIKQIAVDAVNAIPELPVAGVDLMVDEKKNKAVVIEINTQPSIRTHLFPMNGVARDIPSKIIDYYFAETKEIKRNEKIYFEFEPIWEAFQKGLVKEYKLPNAPVQSVKMTKFIVGGRVHHVNYGAWIRRQARDLNLHGYVKHLKNNQTEIVVQGEQENIDKFREIINNNSSKRAKIIDVTEKEITKTLACGFKIVNPELDEVLQDGYYPVRLKGLSQLRRPVKKSSTSEESVKENQVYKEELDKILSSRSWKITKPLRKFSRILRKIKR